MLLVLHTTHVLLYYTFFLFILQVVNGEKTKFLLKSVFWIKLRIIIKPTAIYATVKAIFLFFLSAMMFPADFWNYVFGILINSLFSFIFDWY